MQSPVPGSPPLSDVLAIHPGAVGDIVLLGQLLARLGGRAAVVAKGQRGRLLAELRFGPPNSPDEHPLAERVIDFEAWALDERVVLRSTGHRPEHTLGLCHRLVAFYPPSLEEVRRLAKALGARQSWLLPIRPDEDYPGHLLDKWAGLMNMKPIVASPTAGDDARRLVWRVSREQVEQARWPLPLLGINSDQPYVVIHPGSGGRLKCWPLDNFQILAHRLQARHGGLGILLVVGEAEIERWGEETLHRLGREFPLLQCQDLLQLAGLLAGAKAYVGNDSGPSHLAAALGTPTVALFGATSPVHFAPLGPAVRVVRGETMDEITVEQVTGEMVDWLTG